jgi:hypothetical protein
MEVFLKTTGHRIARTADGKHVLWGHEDAAFLAYVETDEVPEEVLKEVYPKPEPQKPEETKPRRAKETK